LDEEIKDGCNMNISWLKAVKDSMKRICRVRRMSEYRKNYQEKNGYELGDVYEKQHLKMV